MKKKASPIKKRWFNTVTKNFKDSTDDNSVDLIDKCIEYYIDQIDNGLIEVTVRGTLSGLIQESAGLYSYYNSMANDVLQIRMWLEMKQEHASAEKYKWFLNSPEAKKEYGSGLKVTDVRNYIKCEGNLVAYDMMIREMSNLQHQLESIVQTLETRGMSLSQVVKLKIAGIEDIWIDLTKETTNA